MKSKGKNTQLKKLSLDIGDFIRYWGFRRIHGAIWAQLYLSKTSLSCTDLTRNLDLSKALVSPALEELLQYKLIEEAPSPNQKSKMYRAADNINEVIQNVLRTRESVILKTITKDFSKLDESDDSTIDHDRLKKLGEMIMAANLMLEILLNQNDILKLPMEFDL